MARAVEAPAEASEATSQRILLAAERLFAERGFDGVSVREIAGAASANIAAISYHFGSKSELFVALFRARARELNRERHARLKAALQNGAVLEDILRALLAPPILWRDGSSGRQTTSRFLTRAMTETTPELRRILEGDVSHLKAFLDALREALPQLNDAELSWMLHFVGALPHQCTDANFKRVRALSQGACDTEDLSAVLERAVSFALGGVEALLQRAAPAVRSQKRG